MFFTKKMLKYLSPWCENGHMQFAIYIPSLRYCVHDGQMKTISVVNLRYVFTPNQSLSFNILSMFYTLKNYFIQNAIQYFYSSKCKFKVSRCE